MFLKELKYIITDILSLVRPLISHIKHQHFRNEIKYQKRDNPIYLLGNGPSLTSIEQVIKDKRDKIDLCCVNFSVNSDLFFILKPQMLVFADPIFYLKIEDKKVKETYCLLQSNVDWPLTIYIQHYFPKWFNSKLFKNTNITVKRYSSANWNPKAAIFQKLHLYLFKKGITAPIARNVMIAAIYSAINSGYKHIELYGMENSWMHNTIINEENIPCLIDEHFYGKTFRPWIKPNGDHFKLHELLDEWKDVFYTYHDLYAYAKYLNVKIINKTKKTFIDAFPRR